MKRTQTVRRCERARAEIRSLILVLLLVLAFRRLAPPATALEAHPPPADAVAFTTASATDAAEHPPLLRYPPGRLLGNASTAAAASAQLVAHWRGLRELGYRARLVVRARRHRLGAQLHAASSPTRVRCGRGRHTATRGGAAAVGPSPTSHRELASQRASCATSTASRAHTASCGTMCGRAARPRSLCNMQSRAGSRWQGSRRRHSLAIYTWAPRASRFGASFRLFKRSLHCRLQPRCARAAARGALTAPSVYVTCEFPPKNSQFLWD